VHFTKWELLGMFQWLRDSTHSIYGKSYANFQIHQIVFFIGLCFQIRSLFPRDYPTINEAWNHWRNPSNLSNSTNIDTYETVAWTLPRLYEPINLAMSNMPSLRLYATTISYQSHKLIALQPPIQDMGDDSDSVNICLQFVEELTSVDTSLIEAISAIQSCTNMFTLDLRARAHWTYNSSAEDRFYTSASARCEKAMLEIEIVLLQIKELQNSCEEMRDMMAKDMNYLLPPQRSVTRFIPFRNDRVTEWKKALAIFATGDSSREDDVQETLLSVHNLLQEVKNVLIAARWGVMGNVYQKVWRESEDILKLLAFQHELRNRKP